jgi:hypothetical protein
VCQSAPGGVKTGIGTCHGVWWPPIPGWCRKLGARRAFPSFVPRNVGLHRRGQRNRGTGLRPGRPRARRRGLVETATREDYLPRPVRVRTTCSPKPNRKRPHLSLSLFQSKFRFPPKVSCPARSIVSRPFIIFGSLHLVFFVVVLLCRGDAVATVNKNTP